MKIIAEFDTVEKTLAVTSDGAPVADVEEVYVSRDHDGRYGCGLTTRRRDKQADAVHVTRLVASEAGLCPAGEAGPAPSKAQRDVRDYFDRG